MGKKVKKEVEAPPKDVFDPLMIESKKTGTVVLMLKSEEDEVLSRACEAIYKFADKCDDNKLQLLELGVLESLLRLLHHEERNVKRFACMAFGVMASLPEARRHLRKGEGIVTAIQLLGDEDDVCNEFASLFLSHMSVDFASKLAISRADGIEPLINLLASPDPDVQKNVIQSILNLAEDFQSRGVIRDAGGIAAILELLKSDYAMIQELCLKTLAIMTQDGESRIALRDNDGLEQLVSFLGSKDFEELHIHALSVLSNCLEDSESLDDIRNSGGLERLLGFILEPNTAPHVQAFTARALARAAKNVENGKILHEQEVEKVLITMCTSENDVVRTAACEAVSSLSSNLASKGAFGKLEGIPPLISLLSAENMSVRETACLALADLTLNNTNNSAEIITSGGADVLITSLQSSSEKLVVNAAACLINMAHDFAIRHDITKRGIIGALVEPLKLPSSRVQSKISQAIATYVVGAEGRAELCTRGGLAPLVQLLESRDDDVRKNASWALLASCGDPPSAAAISKLGALELLQEINSSEQRRSSHSISLYESLLDFNLPAKFSLIGRLAPHNIITDGFYDVGQLRPDSKFYTLEDLSKQEINQRRAVILINCKRSDSVSELPPAEGGDEADRESAAPVESPPVESPRPLKTSGNSSKRESSRSGTEETGERRVSSKTAHVRRKKKDKEAQQREEAERARIEREALEADRKRQKEKDNIEAAQLLLSAEKNELELEQKSGYRPPVDSMFQSYVEDVTKYIQPMASLREQVVALAQYVSEKMGGEIDRGKLMEFSWELHLSQLKLDSQSNIVSIGKINRGIHYHRALLYKALADRIGVPCSLVRGQYNRAWNEVLVPVSLERGAPKLPPKKYMIDLIHQCGRLISMDSPEAVQYQSL